MTAYFARHGEGPGIEQDSLLARRVAGFKIQLIVSSPVERALQTSVRLKRALEKPPREIGLRQEPWLAEYGKAVLPADGHETGIIVFEDSNYFAARIARAFRRYDSPKDNVLFVSDEDVSRMTRTLTEHEDPAAFMMTEPLEPSEVIQIDSFEIMRNLLELRANPRGIGPVQRIEA